MQSCIVCCFICVYFLNLLRLSVCLKVERNLGLYFFKALKTHNQKPSFYFNLNNFIALLKDTFSILGIFESTLPVSFFLGFLFGGSGESYPRTFFFSQSKGLYPGIRSNIARINFSRFLSGIFGSCVALKTLVCRTAT